jgi:hypothetical protein
MQQTVYLNLLRCAVVASSILIHPLIASTVQAQTPQLVQPLIFARLSSSDQLVTQAQAKLEQKKYSEAIELLTQAIAQYKQGSTFHLGTLYGTRGTVYTLQGVERKAQFDRNLLNLAKADLDRAVGMESNGLSFTNFQAMVNKALGLPTDTAGKGKPQQPVTAQSPVKRDPPQPESQKTMPQPSTPATPQKPVVTAEQSTAAKRSPLRGLKLGVAPEQLFAQFQAAAAPESMGWNQKRQLFYPSNDANQCIAKGEAEAKAALDKRLNQIRKESISFVTIRMNASTSIKQAQERYENTLQGMAQSCQNKLLGYDTDPKSGKVTWVRLTSNYLNASYGYNLNEANISTEDFVAGFGKRLGVTFNRKLEDNSRIETLKECSSSPWPGASGCDVINSELVIDKTTYYEAKYEPCACRIIVNGGKNSTQAGITLVDVGKADAVRY